MNVTSAFRSPSPRIAGDATVKTLKIIIALSDVDFFSRHLANGNASSPHIYVQDSTPSIPHVTFGCVLTNVTCVRKNFRFNGLSEANAYGFMWSVRLELLVAAYQHVL